MDFPGSNDSKVSTGDTYERNGIDISHITADEKKFEPAGSGKDSNVHGESKHNSERMSPQKSAWEHQSVSSADPDS